MGAAPRNFNALRREASGALVESVILFSREIVEGSR